ncbi:MAG TPA: OmpW family outer membrane protein [Thermoanaerobaculia bacterium]|jgi:opacity protein-like surface antigen
MIKRTVLVLSLLLFPLMAAAQNNELGVFISTSQFDDNELTDGVDTFDVEFDEDMGYGILYNRFWGTSFSTEFGYQRLGADLTVSFEDIAENAGDLNLDILTATGQFHFLRGGFFSPYIGAGAAYVSGEAGAIDEDELGEVDLENEIDFLANAGVNIGLGRGFAIFVDGKYIMYEARGEGDDEDDALDVNPLIIAAGIKLRF